MLKDCLGDVMAIKTKWTPWAIIDDRINRRFQYEGYNEDGSSDVFEIEIVPSKHVEELKRNIFGFKKKLSGLDKMRAANRRNPSVFLSMIPNTNYPTGDINGELFDEQRQPVGQAFKLRVVQCDNAAWALCFVDGFEAKKFVNALGNHTELALQFRHDAEPIITLPLPHEDGLQVALSRFNKNSLTKTGGL